VLAREGVPPDRFLHVGDDELGDVQTALLSKLRVPVHVMRPLALFELTPEGRALLDGWRPTRWQDDLWVALVANCAVFAADREPYLARDGGLFDDPERFGYAVLGPLVFGFLASVARRAAVDGVASLEFIGREALGLSEAWDRIASHPGVTRVLPAAHDVARPPRPDAAVHLSPSSPSTARRDRERALVALVEPGATSADRSARRVYAALAALAPRAFVSRAPDGRDGIGPLECSIAESVLGSAEDADGGALPDWSRRLPRRDRRVWPRPARNRFALRGVHRFARDVLDALGDDALDLEFDSERVLRPLRLVVNGRWAVPRVRASLTAPIVV
jgi:hypothetical protein